MICTICNNEMKEVFSFGKLYISDFIPLNNNSNDYPMSDLTMMLCPKCGLGKIRDVINPDILYKKQYWYYSGINSTMQNALKNVVDSCINSINYNSGDIWLDIASNDGTLLSYVPKDLIKIGIDPADSRIQTLAKKHGTIVNDYFSKKAFESVCNKKARFITCIAMFYDLENPHQFLNDIYDILMDDGLFVIQISYTPLMLYQLEFGNICAEHVMYYNLSNIKLLLEQHGFIIEDCELNDINGGSFRVYCTKAMSNHFRSQQQRDVAFFRMNSLLEYEQSRNMEKLFNEFYDKIANLKSETISYILKEKESGKTIYGYGASTKGNTLLQFFELDNKLITKIAERNPIKHGLKTIGSEIPICSEDEMRTEHPDYLLILPWHFVEEFKNREKEYLDNGGKFIIPCPQFQIYTNNKGELVCNT